MNKTVLGVRAEGGRSETSTVYIVALRVVEGQL